MATETPSGPRLRRPNLKQEVAQHIRDQILSGRARPGDRIDQESIAAELGLSRLPVREALITLEAEGLVENVARRGSFVAALEPDDISDHFEMYGLLSGLAAGRVASLSESRPDILTQLEEINAQMRASTDPAEHDRLNFTFHQTINKAGTSRRLRAVLRMLAHNMPTNFFVTNTEWAWKERALDEHDLIVAALRSRDERAASQAVEQHFRHTGAQAVHLLNEAGFWGDEPANQPAKD